jgi:TolA-binding protein
VRPRRRLFSCGERKVKTNPTAIEEDEGEMARPRQRNIVERLADAGEEAIQRIGNAPGADRVLGTLGSMKERVDDLQKRVRGLESLEKRLNSLERRVDKLEGKGKSPARKTSSTAKRSTASRKSSSSS